MRRNIPTLIIAVMAVLAGLATVWSYHQSTTSNHSIAIVAPCSTALIRQPRQLVASCADANSLLANLRWKQWGDATAYATGVGRWNDCTPSCVDGHWHSEPVSAWAWSIKNGRYTHLESSDSRFFPSPYVVTSYPSVG